MTNKSPCRDATEIIRERDAWRARAEAAEAAIWAAYEAAATTDDETRQAVTEAGYVRYQAHQRGGARGQTITEWDGPESHVIEAYAARIRALTPPDAVALRAGALAEAREEGRREGVSMALNALLTEGYRQPTPDAERRISGTLVEGILAVKCVEARLRAASTEDRTP